MLFSAGSCPLSLSVSRFRPPPSPNFLSLQLFFTAPSFMHAPPACLLALYAPPLSHPLCLFFCTLPIISCSSVIHVNICAWARERECVCVFASECMCSCVYVCMCVRVFCTHTWVRHLHTCTCVDDAPMCVCRAPYSTTPRNRNPANRNRS